MEGSSTKKSISLEALVSQSANVNNDLKEKLKDIIKTGKDYEYDVSTSIKNLINSSDQEIVLLSIQAVSELVKSEEKTEIYAHKDIIVPILKILERDVSTHQTELIKQCCRALGNLCCDCDTSRKIILENNGVLILKTLLEKCLVLQVDEIKLLVCKTMLNFGIGGQEFCGALVKEELPSIINRILNTELSKDDFDDDMISTSLLMLSVLNDNIPELLQSDEVNKSVLNVLEKTTNTDISEMCLDHLNTQAEHDSVKTLIATEGGVQQICSRLEVLIEQHEARKLMSDDSVVEAIIKQACDLIVIILTGDEAMHTLYKNGTGEVYQTMVTWLESSNSHLLTTAVLAIGNFARQDDYCIQMMDNNIYDKLLDIFEQYSADAGGGAGARRTCVAALGALRNLGVCARTAGRAPPRAARLLLAALPAAADQLVLYKLLAALRMLIHRQSHVARQLAEDHAALRAIVAGAAACSGGAGLAGEAPRLLAWAVREGRGQPVWGHIVQTEGCIACIMNMVLTSHSVMQNEAILALTLLAIPSLRQAPPTPDSESPEELARSSDHETAFTTQLIKAEIGKHIAVLIDTNCAKMPVEVAENLLAFLEITSKKNDLCLDYKEANVHGLLGKFQEVRSDFSDDLKVCIANVIRAISNDN